MGIDGYTCEGYPVQVKQSENIGRNVVDNFETAIRRSKKTRGVIVAFSFSKGAYDEIARVKREGGLEVEARARLTSPRIRGCRRRLCRSRKR